MRLHAALRCRDHRVADVDRQRSSGLLSGMAAGAFAFTALASVAQAEMVGFEVLSVENPALEGRAFGDVGAVEKITGRATIALDPADPRNAVIADIDLAPKNAEDLVEAVADVEILRPLGGGNGTILLEVPNRGRKLMSILFDETADATSASRLEQASDAGSGFLLSQGYTLVWVGWQGDLPAGPQALRIDVPAIEGTTGLSREEFVFDDMDNPVTVPLTYPAAAVPGDAELTVRAGPEDKREQPADLSFRFLDPQQVEITRPEGFDAGAIYELIYTARDPLVLGMGFAGVRDLVAFLRNETEGNPLGEPATHAYAHGVSQSGRFLRDYLYWGFNEDEQGRIVFDAINPHVPGTRRTYTNFRFAQTGRNPSSQADRLYQADQFPFTYAVLDDPVSGRRDGLMARCRLSSTCPKVIETDTEAELFGSRGSLLVTDTEGNHVDLPPDVRAYLIAGHPHFAGPGSVASMSEACALSR
ncbi:MAG: alpha/beta hydrolase domain-containing protein, partial [Geminicoccaceae bacterium]